MLALFDSLQSDIHLHGNCYGHWELQLCSQLVGQPNECRGCQRRGTFYAIGRWNGDDYRHFNAGLFQIRDSNGDSNGSRIHYIGGCELFSYVNPNRSDL